MVSLYDLLGACPQNHDFHFDLLCPCRQICVFPIGKQFSGNITNLNAPVVAENNAPISAVGTRVAPTFVVYCTLTSHIESCKVR